VLIGTLLQAFPLWRIADDELTVKLNVPIKPTATNGQWNAEEKQVRWSRSLLTADSESTEFPAMCYAFWTMPHAKTQTERFGKVILDGEELAAYGLWHRGLSPAEAKEWEMFIESLKPGSDLPGRVRSFRFSNEPLAQGENRNSLSAEPRRLLLEGLGEKANP
jgi:hypothetical protein